MNNLDKYFKESCKYDDDRQCFFFQKRTGKPDCYNENQDCKKCMMENIVWLLNDYKGSILTEEEKEYLRNVIKIYGNKFKHIEKQHCGDNDEFKDQDVIYVWIENPKYPSLVTAGMYFFTTHDLQFAGLEFNTYYTLKDLGL